MAKVTERHVVIFDGVILGCKKKIHPNITFTIPPNLPSEPSEASKIKVS